MFSYSGRILSYFILFLPISLVIGQGFVSINVLFICALYLIILINGKIKINLNFTIIFFLIFYLSIFLSSFFSDFKTYSFQYAFLFIRFLIISLAIYYVLTNIKNFEKIFLYLLFSILTFIICDALFQFIFGFNIISEQYIRGETTRLSGVFGKENILGSYLYKFYPILLSLYFINKKNISNPNTITLLILFLLFFFIILITGERTSTILFILINFLIIFFLKKNYVYKINIFIIIFILPILILSFNHKIKNRLIDYTAEQISFKKPYILDDVYQDLFSTTFEIYLDNKILGSGPNTFRIKCNEKKYQKKFSCSTSPHNFYLQILAETGLIGFTSILIIYLYFCYSLFISWFNKFPNISIYNAYILVNISIIINFFPFAQTGSFFSNWLMTISIFPFAFYFYYKSLLKKV